MKKRDFYILGFLFCLIIYAASNRKTPDIEANTEQNRLQTPQAKTATKTVKSDSISTNAEIILKAGV